MNINLRAGEKLYLNGAVIRVNRKVSVELLNDATFLLESHIIQAHEATTPLRQIYFAVQVMLMDPQHIDAAMGLALPMIATAMANYRTPEIQRGVQSVLLLVENARYFEALKVIRSLYPAEEDEMRPGAAIEQAKVA